MNELTERYTQTAREFPEYPLDSLPDIPPHWTESSWHNDACPSFIICDTLGVFVDWADPALAEFPNWRADGTMKRFSLVPMLDRQHLTGDEMDSEGRPEGYQSDDWRDLLSAAIAELFVENLQAQLTVEQWREMRRVNVQHKGDGICASHDYCDANMPMAEAFETVMGYAPMTLPNPDGGERVFCSDVDTPESEASQEADCALWNRAWAIAKDRYLTQKPGRPAVALLRQMRDQIDTFLSNHSTNG